MARRANGRPVAMAVEGCTGWRYVVEEITAAGYAAHMAEPADTQAARGRKRHAKTDRSDAKLMRELLQTGELPESWIPPTEVLEWRERVRLYKTLVDQRTMWTQRIHAELFQHGVPVPDGEIRSATTRQWLSGDDVELTPAARHRITVGYTMLDATDAAAVPLRDQLRRFGMRQPACRALVEAIFGVGGLTAVAVWSELGDCRRFSRSEQAVRHTGLDVTVDASDLRRAGGHLTRQGPSTLRWALFEAGMCAAHRQPRPRLLPHGQRSSRRQAGSHRRRSPIRPPLLPHPAQPRPRTGVRHPDLTTAGYDGRERPPQHHRSPPRSAPANAMPASDNTGRPSNTDATALPANGGHPITIVVADDTMFVEHPGNAGRPHATANRPTTSLHRPSSWSRTYVLASLRALQLDQHLRPGATRIKRALTTALTQETAYLCEFNSRWCQRANTQLEAHGPTPAMRSMPMRTTRPAGGSSPGGNFTSGPR